MRETLGGFGTNLLSATLRGLDGTLNVTRRTLDVTTDAMGEITSQIKSKVDVGRLFQKLANQKCPNRETIRERMQQPSSEWEISKEEQILVLEMNFLSLLETCEVRMHNGTNESAQESFDWCKNPPVTTEVPLSALVLYLKSTFEELKEKSAHTKLNLVDFEKQLKSLTKFAKTNEPGHQIIFRTVESKLSDTQPLAEASVDVKSVSLDQKEESQKRKKYIRYSEKSTRRRQGVETQGGSSLLKEQKKQREEMEEQLLGLTDMFKEKQYEFSRKIQEDKKKWKAISDQTDDNLDAVQSVTKKTAEFTSRACSQQCWLWFGMMSVAITWVITYIVMRFFRIESMFFSS